MNRFIKGIGSRITEFFVFTILLCTVSSATPLADWIIRGAQYYSVSFLTKCRNANQNQPIKLLVLGSSITQRGIDPAILCDNSNDGFNLSSNGQSQLNSLSLLEWGLNHNITPDVVILDAYPNLGQSNGIEAARGIAQNIQSPFIGPGLRAALYTLDPYSAIIWLKRSLYCTMFDPEELSFNKSIAKDNGFIASHVPPNDMQPKPCNKRHIESSWLQKAALRKIDRLCETNNIQLFILIPPQLCSESFTPVELSKNATWIDGHDWPESEDYTHYYDDHHLTHLGAQHYSRWLKNEINTTSN